MEYRTKAELNSCKGDAYGGDLVHRSFKVTLSDWEALQAYARENGTTAGEVVRCLIRELLERK